QIAAKTEPTPTVIDNQTCHHAGGVFEAMRSSMAKVLMGGMKLSVTLSVEFGSVDIGIHKNQGTINKSISGIIKLWASRISLTAAPIPIISEPKTRYMIRKKIRM